MTLPVLFLILARGGSQRVPGKNLRTVAGIPLVGHAIRIGRQAAALVPDGPHAVVVSTDDLEIAAAARAWHGEVPSLRPAHLATAEATSLDAALHVADELTAAGRTFRAVALLQPTSPLTDPRDVAAAIDAVDRGAPSSVSVVSSHPASWHLGHATGPTAGDGAARHEPGTPDQLLAGAFYVIEPDRLRRERRWFDPASSISIAVPPERAVDIDEPSDLVVAEAYARARPVERVPLGDRTIGQGRPAFVIAEAGVNHDGEVDVAHRLIDAAADAGADAVKFQTFDPVSLAVADAPLAGYQVAGVDATDQVAMLAALALPADAWTGLQAHAADRGIVFLSSPFDAAAADLLDGLGVPAFKVASGELTNHPFLAHVAAKGRPLLVSTGMADMAEVADALDAIAAAGNPPVALFHCVSSYPAPASDANLRAMATLRAAFGRPTGWSDHSLGIELPTAAVALGAELIEKHLTLDRGGRGPDHQASLEPDAFGRMVAAIRSVESALGDGQKVPTPAEASTARVARRSLHWRGDRVAGERVTPDDLVALRPGTGLPPSAASGFVGRRLARDVRAGQPVAPGDVEESR